MIRLGLILCALIASGLLVIEMRASARLAAENGSLRASNEVLARQVHDARIGAAIAAATMADEQARALALADALQQINGGPDAPLPDHIRALLRDIPGEL